ncbi:hypothetical protein MPL1032_50246 [Mesorhizobium plurifarium]|uniref:Uncharacterized protein n=1 Tax=Mesorhizobium plurifarium TaxID=69974 RepID=A0A0K2W5Q8_MESPL|nr:hypothetical protein MPL1032_50246 [Mesorhizobium plurifarium]
MRLPWFLNTVILNCKLVGQGYQRPFGVVSANAGDEPKAPEPRHSRAEQGAKPVDDDPIGVSANRQKHGYANARIADRSKFLC